jgi:hypothetical protein
MIDIDCRDFVEMDLAFDRLVRLKQVDAIWIFSILK